MLLEENLRVTEKQDTRVKNLKTFVSERGGDLNSRHRTSPE